jgi:PAS domain S-box-containing protein
MTAALVVWVAVEVDHETTARHEALFNTEQSLHALLIRRALEAHFESVAASVSALAPYAAGRCAADESDDDALNNLLAAELAASPDILSFAVVDAGGRIVVVESDGTPAGRAAAQQSAAWLVEHDAEQTASGRNVEYLPPHITSGYQMLGVMAPLVAARQPRDVLVAVTDLQSLVARYMSAVRPGGHGSGWMLDGRGTVVFDENRAVIGSNILEGAGQNSDLARVVSRMLGEPVGTDEFRFTATPDAVEVRQLIAWDTIFLGEHRLVVALSAPDFEVNATLGQLRVNLVQAAVIVAAVLLVTGALHFRARQRLLERSARELDCRIQERTAALNASEETLRLAFDLTPVGFAMLGLDRRFERVNRSFCDTLGYPPEELRTLNCAQLVHPADKDAARAMFDSLVAGDKMPVPHELRHIARNGRVVHCLFHAALMRDAAGQPQRYLVQVLDITERKRAEERLRQRTAQLEVLRQMALDVTRQLDPAVVLQSIVAQAARLLPGAEAGLYLYDAEHDDLEWAMASTSVGMVAPGSRLRRGEGLSGKVLQSRRPMYVADYKNWAGRAPDHADHNWHVVAAAPVTYGDAVLGVLKVVAGPQTTFSEADADVVELFAAHAAIALHNAQLLQRETQQRELAEALAQASAAVGSTLELDQVFDRILEQVQRVVGGSTANVALIENGVSRPVRWRGYEGLGVRVPLSQIGLVVAETASLQRMVETGRPVVVDDTATYPGWADVPEMGCLRSYVGAPIRVGGRTVGFLNIDSPIPGQFGVTDGERLVAFAHYAAIAIENARLYEQARCDAARAATLVEEINHRVKNNLSAILGLLYVELSHARWRSGDGCAAVLEDLSHRIQGLATLHSVLSDADWAALRLSDLSARIIQTVLGALSPDRSIRLGISPSPVLVTPGQAQSLALIIHELAANAIEHAWSDQAGGCLSVRVTLEGDIVVLQIRDDGVGYPDAALEAQGGGVGLFLVRSLVEQGLGGQLQLHNDDGAVATVRFERAIEGTAVDERSH